jgi:hypothetical protein
LRSILKSRARGALHQIAAKVVRNGTFSEWDRLDGSAEGSRDYLGAAGQYIAAIAEMREGLRGRSSLSGVRDHSGPSAPRSGVARADRDRGYSVETVPGPHGLRMSSALQYSPERGRKGHAVARTSSAR